MTESQDLQQTPLHALHVRLGGKMVPFAGYEMPVQYAAGIMKEHLHTRSQAGLFDVSHMGQVVLRGPGAASALERLVPGDIAGLAPGRMRYTQFTNDAGGILDDLMVTNAEDHLFVVVNAACKDQDIAHMRAGLGGDCELEVLEDRALMALQGPQAAAVLSRFAPGCEELVFLSGRRLTVDGIDAFVTRSGYTGEDGYEVSVPSDMAAAFAEKLVAQPEVEAIGLGARDSLRLEAGMCLYGHDIDESTTPVEGQLTWSIGKRRREEGGFPGAAEIQRQLADGPARKRVGILPEGRAPAREHTPITDAEGAELGHITSGGFAPSVGRPIAVGYVSASHAATDTPVNLMVRGEPRPAKIAALPFVKPNYHRG